MRNKITKPPIQIKLMLLVMVSILCSPISKGQVSRSNYDQRYARRCVDKFIYRKKHFSDRSKKQGAGKIEIKIDGKTLGTVDLSISDTRKARQVVYELNGLSNGKHSIDIINRGKGKVAVDALIIR